jgi:formylglycine-generating enzyme
MGMLNKTLIVFFLMAVALGLTTESANANVFNMTGGLTSLDFVSVGNPGNAGISSGVDMDTRICGAVNYGYNIGKYEVTAGQYCEFLNAVAKSDTYGLYNPNMDYDLHPSNMGCNIKRTGTAGNYSYRVTTDWANRPVNYVSWGDAARFSNWLSNGQPTGNQNSSTTENGSYNINGATSDHALSILQRQNQNGYFIPSEDEWYKAAFHKNDGVTGNYWGYTTEEAVNKLLPPHNFRTANYYDGSYLIGSPYYRTEAGSFTDYPSSYGTFDQGGNVEEWDESRPNFNNVRGIQGGGFDGFQGRTYRLVSAPTTPSYEMSEIGFRVVYIPEPNCITLLFAGAAALLLIRQRHLKARTSI